MPTRVQAYWNVTDAQLERREGNLWVVITTGGGGSTDHATLTHLDWLLSGHARTVAPVTGTLAGFNGAGTATYYVVGADVQAWGADLDAIAALASTAGMLSRTGAGAFAVRTLTAPAAGFTISNPTGSGGNPTWVLANDLAALEGLGSTGIAARTAADTWAQRTLQAPAAGFTITNPAGVAGDPTFVLANDLAALEALSTTGYAHRTGTDTWTLDTAAQILDDILTTKGDLLSYSTLPVRVGVGASATTAAGPPATFAAATRLIADSTATPGVTWGVGYKRTVYTTQNAAGGSGGYWTHALQDRALCSRVKVTVQGPGHDGTAGAVGATANGGTGGSPGAWATGTWRRTQIADQLFVRIGRSSPNNSGTAAGQKTIVETVNSGYTSSSLSNSAYTLIFANEGNNAGSSAASSFQGALGLRSADTWTSTPGPAQAAGGTGVVADQTPYTSSSTQGAAQTGCAGGGLAAGIARVGGGFGAQGPLVARAGGAVGGNPGLDGIHGGGNVGGFLTASSDVAEDLWEFGGTGGGANAAGVGGKGGDGAPGCGGGGGGASSVGIGGAFGLGGDGWVIIEEFSV